MGSSLNDPMRLPGELPGLRTELDPFCIDRFEAPNRRGKLPAVHVSWEAAEEACDRRGARLCSEAEWELACAGRQGWRFPYGDTYRPGACNVGHSGDLKPAGSFPACRSSWGVFDLAGNAAEWTASQWTGAIGMKVVKGGAAGQPEATSRCAARQRESARARKALIGFRCCADL